MKILSDIWIIARKDLQVISKDRGMLAIVFLLPLIFGSLLSNMFNAQATQSRVNGGMTLQVYLVNEDTGNYGKQVEQALLKMDVLSLETLPSHAGGRLQADQGVSEGKKISAVLIPADFSEKIQAHQQAEIQLIVNPGQKQLASIAAGLLNYAVSPVVLEGEIRYGIRTLLNESGVLKEAPPETAAGVEAQTYGVIMTQLQKMMQQPLISVQAESTTKTADLQVNFFGLIMPGFAVYFSFFLVAAIGESLFKERDEGTFRRLQSAPIRSVAIIGGKLLAFAILVWVMVAFLLGLSASFFKMDLGKSPLGLMLMTLALSLVVAAFGLMVAALARTGKQADNIGTLLGFILGGLGGCLPFGLTPLPLMDNSLGIFARFIPQGQAVIGYYRLMNEGAGVAQVLPQVGILLAMTLLFGAVAAWRLKWV